MASEESMDNPTNGSGGTHRGSDRIAVFNLAEGQISGEPPRRKIKVPAAAMISCTLMLPNAFCPRNIGLSDPRIDAHRSLGQVAP
jgi:hypothetical protein